MAARIDHPTPPRTLASPPVRRSRLGSLAPLTAAVLSLVVKRALGNPSLVAFTLLGLVVCVALVAAVPLYSDGMIAGLLQREVARPSGTQPPLALRVRHQESPRRPTTVEQFRRLDRYLTAGAADVVGLPLRGVVRQLNASSHQLFPYEQYVRNELPKIYVPGQARYAELAALSGLAEHTRIVEGEGLPTEASPPGEVPVVLTRAAADELRMEVGQRYWYVGPDLEKPESVVVRVVGLWEPTDPENAAYWQSAQADVTYNFTLFVSEADFFERVLPAFPSNPALGEYSWLLVFDHGALHPTRVDRVRGGLRSLELDVARLMPDTRVDASPGETLDWVSKQSSLLKTLLFVLSVPLLAVALYYVYVSLAMVMEHQRGEIAFLRSRGASPFQVVLVYLVESAASGAVALGLGLVVGMLVAQVIGRAVGFLQFAVRPWLPTYVGGQVLQYSLLAVGLAVACTIIPAARATRYSIVAHERQAARSEGLVRWSGFFFEAVALAAAAYGYYALSSGSELVRLGRSGEYLIEPLFLLVPPLTILALSLVYRRLVPLLGALLALLLARLAGAPTLTALRHVYRAPGAYTSLVFLVAATLGMGVFSASAARTIDSNYVDRARYRVPADLAIVENWEFDPDAPEGTFAFLEPPLDALRVPGVRATTRVQLYTARSGTGRGLGDMQILGLDRDTFAQVSWWRSDFARQPLGALLNALSVDESALIVSSSYLQQYQLRPGDATQLSFLVPSVLEPKVVDFRVVESVDYFPTLYPERGQFAIANLDYLHDQLGLGMYQVWLSLEPTVRTVRVVDAIQANGVEIISILDQRVVVNLGRLDPQRTGILGLLSLAYIVAALLTVFGFFLHTLLSFQQRTPQLGVLRTIGLSSGQLVRMLLIEAAFVVLLGVAAGVGFGTLASRIFIPYLQVDADRLGTTPPFAVQAAWGDVRWILLVLLLMLIAGTLTTLGLLRRMKLNQAVRLGERV